MIGDITPKALKVTGEEDQFQGFCDREGGVEGLGADMEKVRGSSWNHAGSTLSLMTGPHIFSCPTKHSHVKWSYHVDVIQALPS